MTKKKTSAGRQVVKVLQAPYSRQAYLLQHYRLTLEAYDDMLKAQGGACAICKMKPRTRVLVVDHDHKCCPGKETCGKCVRGLLCDRCNRVLGMFYDDAKRFKSASEYLLRK